MTTNWAGNITFGAAGFHHPTTLPELQKLVAGSSDLRALGSGHSFNRIADTGGDLVSVARLPSVLDIDSQANTVTVAAGMLYGELARPLHHAGYALGNLGSLPHISVAGACATGTHGSGVANRNLPAAVSAMTFVAADGELVTVSRADDPSAFPGMIVSLGALGIVTTMTLDIVPTFDITQYVFDDMPGESVVGHFDEIMESAYSVSLFTDWTEPRVYQVWVKRRSDDTAPAPPTDDWYGAKAAEVERHPIQSVDPVNTTKQLGVPGPWHERLPHFKLEFTPSSGDELQTEYLVSREHALAALAAVDEIKAEVSAVLQISEVRTIAADDLWLSPSYGRDSVALHFTWIPDIDAVAPVLFRLEERLAPYTARPHWGKQFRTTPDVIAGLYEKLPDFRALMATYDPTRKFANEFIDTYFPA
ncbi:MAG: FAD-binding protein [Actinomycetota bacterium]